MCRGLNTKRLQWRGAACETILGMYVCFLSVLFFTLSWLNSNSNQITSTHVRRKILPQYNFQQKKQFSCFLPCYGVLKYEKEENWGKMWFLNWKYKMNYEFKAIEVECNKSLVIDRRIWTLAIGTYKPESKSENWKNNDKRIYISSFKNRLSQICLYFWFYKLAAV